MGSVGVWLVLLGLAFIHPVFAFAAVRRRNAAAGGRALQPVWRPLNSGRWVGLPDDAFLSRYFPVQPLQPWKTDSRCSFSWSESSTCSLVWRYFRSFMASADETSRTDDARPLPEAAYQAVGLGAASRACRARASCDFLRAARLAWTMFLAAALSSRLQAKLNCVRISFSQDLPEQHGIAPGLGLDDFFHRPVMQSAFLGFAVMLLGAARMRHRSSPRSTLAGWQVIRAKRHYNRWRRSGKTAGCGFGHDAYSPWMLESFSVTCNLAPLGATVNSQGGPWIQGRCARLRGGHLWDGIVRISGAAAESRAFHHSSNRRLFGANGTPRHPDRLAEQIYKNPLFSRSLPPRSFASGMLPLTFYQRASPTSLICARDGLYELKESIHGDLAERGADFGPLADGKIDDDEVKALKKELWEDGKIDDEEVKFLIRSAPYVEPKVKAKAKKEEVNPKFTALFFKAIEENVLKDGKIDAAEAGWLRGMLYADGKIDEDEKKFLARIKKAAKSTSPQFESLYEDCMSGGKGKKKK